MPGKSCACGAIPSACCRKTSWPPTNSTFIDVLSFCTRFAVTIAPRVSCTNNGRILLAKLLQSSRSTFSWGSFLSFFAFKEGILDTQISALGGWPTVSGRLVCTRRAGLHQCLILLPACLAVHPQLLGLLEPATTGSAGVACDRTPEQICLPDGPASLSQRMGRERGAH